MLKRGFLNHASQDRSQVKPSKCASLNNISPCAVELGNGNANAFIGNNTKIVDSKYTPCASCKVLTMLRCAECKRVPYCSKECRRVDYPVHQKICARLVKPYTFNPPSRIFKNAVFRVKDFMGGPDQPMDPPDTEDFEDVQMLWRYQIKIPPFYMKLHCSSMIMLNMAVVGVCDTSVP